MFIEVHLYSGKLFAAQPLTLELRLQKRAARIILDANSRASSVPLFNRLHWTPFYNESRITQCSILFKTIQLTVPEYLIESLRLNSSVHVRNTRFSKFKLNILDSTELLKAVDHL